MAVDKRIELEIALRDSVSLALKAVAENLERINKAQTKGGEGKAEEGSDSFRKIKEHTDGIHKISTEGGKAVTGVAESMWNVAGLLLRGALRWAVLAEEAARFAAGIIQNSQRDRLEWHALAEDTGLTEKFASMLVNAQRTVGIQSPQGKANVLNMMNSIRDMAAGPGSEITKRLGIIGENDIARQIEDLEMKGEHEAAVRLAIKRGSELFEREDKTQAYKYADAWKMQPSFFKGMHAALQTAVPSYMTSLEGAKNWMIGWDIAAKYYAYTTSWLQNLVVKSILPGMPKYWTPEAGAERQFNPEAFGIPADKVEAWKERNKETLSILKDILGIFQRQQNKQSLEKRESGGTVLAGRKYLVGEKGPELFRSNSGQSEMVGGPKIITPKTGGDISSTGASFAAARDAARAAGVSDPETAASIAMLESGWLKRGTGSVFDKSGGTNPFGQTGVGSHGFVIGRDRQKHKVYGSLEEGFADHFRRWGEHYRGTPQDTVENLVKHDYNTVNKNWQKDVLAIHNRMASEASPDYRRDIDGELGGGSGGGLLGAQIIFKNVPEGVETDAEGEGFDNFTINKTRQLQGAY
jgi:hypothetical protein